MDLGTVKIIGQVISSLGITEYIFLPTNKKLGSLTAYDLMSHNEIYNIINDPMLDTLVGRLGISGVAMPGHCKIFLNNPKGRSLIDTIVNNSSAKGKVNISVKIAQTYGEAGLENSVEHENI